MVKQRHHMRDHTPHKHVAPPKKAALHRAKTSKKHVKKPARRLRMTWGKGTAISAAAVFLLVVTNPEILIIPYFAFHGANLTLAEREMQSGFAQANAEWLANRYALTKRLLEQNFTALEPMVTELYASDSKHRKTLTQLQEAVRAVMTGKSGAVTPHDMLRQMIAVRSATASVEFDMKFMPKSARLDLLKRQVEDTFLRPLDFLKDVYRQSRVCWTRGEQKAYICERGPTN